MEELCAEIGAAFLCADLGITPETRDDHAAYIQSWLKVLKDDKRAIFTAASHAQKRPTSSTGCNRMPTRHQPRNCRRQPKQRPRERPRTGAASIRAGRQIARAETAPRGTVNYYPCRFKCVPKRKGTPWKITPHFAVSGRSTPRECIDCLDATLRALPCPTTHTRRHSRMRDPECRSPEPRACGCQTSRSTT
jgi:hypothetical protein